MFFSDETATHTNGPLFPWLSRMDRRCQGRLLHPQLLLRAVVKPQREMVGLALIETCNRGQSLAPALWAGSFRAVHFPSPGPLP